jgi:DNA-binding MarR family transcriptional regulator/GNAT superfamily N-acetyltransferase
MTTTPDPLTDPISRRIDAMRTFNRFYTRRIGVLSEGLLHSEFTLTESRLLWDLAHAGTVTASELAHRLDLDAGYLSRLLRGFSRRGLIKRSRSKADGREVLLSLTAAGRRAFAPLDARSQEEVGAMLAAIPEGQQQELLQAISTIERLLDDSTGRSARIPYLLRAHQPGDIGWVVSRHGALYAQEYQWDLGFEALVARIAADFIDRFEPSREACWIAERDGVNVGCVFLVQWRDETTQQPVEGVAQLRMLLVEPAARGLGIGERLVRECSRFARQAGYRSVRLWTNSVLTAARGIYQKVGYQLVTSERHHSFGHDLVGEIWELPLA